MQSQAILRHSPRDGILVGLAVAHGALLLIAPWAPLIAIGIWWNANTVSHNFIHLPFFRSKAANSAFSLYLSLLLGVPQTIWRDRHLAHHADKPWRFRWSTQLGVEFVLVAALWLLMASQGAAFFLGTWIAGWIGGMVLCLLQGYFEHVGGTISHYGALYNFAFFNDGYHVEHHARPGAHWSTLPSRQLNDARVSAWPAVLRWLDGLPAKALNALERLVLQSRPLQWFVVDRHVRAFRKVLARVPDVRRVTIVGGGLFPRTLLVFRRIAPHVQVTIVDRSAESVDASRSYLSGAEQIVTADYAPAHAADADLLVVPLAYAGDRSEFYAKPSAPLVAVHDWIWRRRGEASVVISIFLLKRLNLVRR